MRKKKPTIKSLTEDNENLHKRLTSKRRRHIFGLMLMAIGSLFNGLIGVAYVYLNKLAYTDKCPNPADFAFKVKDIDITVPMIFIVIGGVYLLPLTEWLKVWRNKDSE